MLDEKKVKLMTRMALYEEQQGREDLKASVCDVGICVYHIYRCIKIRIQRRIAGIP